MYLKFVIFWGIMYKAILMLVYYTEVIVKLLYFGGSLICNSQLGSKPWDAEVTWGTLTVLWVYKV